MEETQTQNTGEGAGGAGSETQTSGLTQIPESIRGNEAFAGYKSMSDLWQGHIDLSTKAKTLESKLTGSIPKLPENATEQDRNAFYTALGRPDKPEAYEFDGEDKNAPEWTNFWKQEFFKAGLPADTAKSLSSVWNNHMQKMVETHNAGVKNEIESAAIKLKAEWGEKYDSNVELAKRLWKKETDGDFDAAFTGETSANRYAILKYVMNMAKKTGEDVSPQGNGRPTGTESTDYSSWFPNSPH